MHFEVGTGQFAAVTKLPRAGLGSEIRRGAIVEEGAPRCQMEELW